MKGTAAAFLSEIRIASAPNLQIQTISVKDEDEEHGGTGLLGKKGDKPSLMDPDDSVSILGGGGSIWRWRRWGMREARTEWETRVWEIAHRLPPDTEIISRWKILIPRVRA